MVSRPEVVSLAGGMPDVAALDVNLIDKAYASLMANRRNYALQYGGGQGDLRLREQIQEIMALGGIMGAAIMSLVTPERSALKYEPCPCLSNDCGRAGSTLGA